MATLSGVAGANKMRSWSTYRTGMCLQAVSKALGTYYLTSDRPGWYSYALRGWQNTPSSRRHYDRTPPKGAVVYFTAGGNGFGHICLSLGGGQVVSTDIPSRGRVGVTTISAIEKAWGRKFLGWADWLMGHSITVAKSAPSGGSASYPSKMNGYAVNKIQYRINQLGYSPKLVEDNKLGAKTIAGIRWAQKKLGVKVDGSWGKNTQAAYDKRSKASKLAVDGKLGPATIKAIQKAVGVKQDGILGVVTKKAMQRHLGVTADGVFGFNSAKALQRRVGTTVDGRWGTGTTKALQKALNAGKF